MLRKLSSFEAHDERIWHVAWNKEGSFFSSCGEDKTVRIWKMVSSSALDSLNIPLVASIEDVQARTIRCCEWSPNSKMIASASFDGTVIIWATQDKTFKFWDQVASLEGHDNEVKSVSWCFDGSYIATCGRDKKVWIWESIVGGEFECVAMLDGHTQDVKFVRWHPTEKVLFSCSYDDTIRVWMGDNEDWYCESTLIGHSSTVWGVALVDDGKRLISCSDDKSLILWENTESSGSGGDRKWAKTATLSDVHGCPIYSIDGNQEHALLASGGGDNSIVLSRVVRNADDGFSSIEIVRSFPESHDGDVNCVRWNPTNSSLLISAGDDGKINIWSLEF